MKTMQTMRAMMLVALMAAGMNTMAQGRGGAGHEMGAHRGAGREMVVSGRGGFEMRGGRQQAHNRPVAQHRAPVAHRRPEVHHPAPAVHHNAPGRWADCVRHMPDGRWGYCRDNRWYYYDCYYEPDYYFAHPVHHFHDHCLGTVAAAAVTTAAVATLISALVH